MRTRSSRVWTAAMLGLTLLPVGLTRAGDSSAPACSDPIGTEGHRRELADPVAAALAAGGWPTLQAYLAQRDTFLAYRKMVARYRWSPSNGFFKNVATQLKQQDIRNPPQVVRDGQKTQKAASELIFHAAAIHPELAQGDWLQSLLQLVEPGPDAPSFTSLQDAQTKIAGFAGFATPAERENLEQQWVCHLREQK